MKFYKIFKLSFLILTMGISSIFAQMKAIIFDCDGVLVDSEYLKFLAWQEALAKKNISFSIEEYEPLVGYSSKAIFQMIKTLKKIDISEDVIEYKNAKYKELQNQKIYPFDEMVLFVKYLSQEKKILNIKLALASSAPKEEILKNLKQIELENVFDLIISGHDDLYNYVDAQGTNKPKPYIYLEASKILNISFNNCIVFEDTSAGIEAAVSAKMTAIAVLNKFTQNQDFSKASKIIYSYSLLFLKDTLRDLLDKK